MIKNQKYLKKMTTIELKAGIFHIYHVILHNQREEKNKLIKRIHHQHANKQIN